MNGTKIIEKISFWKNGKIITKNVICNSFMTSKDVERYAKEHGINEYWWSGIYCLKV